DFRVAAVVANNPGNSHLGSNIFVNIENLPTVWNSPGIFDNLGSDVFYHYVRLSPGTDSLGFEKELESAYRQEIYPGFDVQIYLQPLTDIHFTTDLQNEMTMRDDVLSFVKPIRQRSDILVFSAVAILTLVIATVNFMNLQLVQFTRRTREVAIKRIVGSSRGDLVRQFLVETILVAILALLVAALLCVAFMPWFNSMVAASIDSGIIFTPGGILSLVIAAIAVGLLAGLYPATSIARLSPSNAMRGQVVKGVSASRFRSMLIITQFAISIGLIVSAGVINSQINFALSSGLGFDPTNVVTVELPNAQSRDAYDAMRSELLGEPGVLSVAVGDIIPGRDLSNGTGFSQVNGVEHQFGVRTVTVDDEYFETLGMEFIAGRPLNPDIPTDALGDFSPTAPDRVGAMVVNETAARAAGFSNPADAVGAEVFAGGEFRGVYYTTTGTIVGVIRDVAFGSIRAESASIAFAFGDFRQVMMVRIANDNQAATLAAIDRAWQQNINELPIQRNFLSDSYQVFYAGEQRTFLLFMVLTVIAIGIACLGLYAVTSYIAERRTKEISIRKVLGATVQSLATLLAWDFSKLVLLANVIAWPIAWWGMQRWLSNFAFQTDIGFGIFLLAGVATFAMALATTFQRAWVVATRNPVESLRAE
ncbi:MAG: FtsX-like permease family protein, partial [Gammaproteobacteria bacterium]